MNSGMSKTAWCRANGISVKQFFYWQRILRREAYEAYGKRTQAVSMLYLNEDLTIEMVNLRTGDEKLINARKKR